MSLKVVPFDRFGMDSHLCSTETLSLIFAFNNAVALKNGSKVTQGHGKYHHSIERV